MTVLVIAVLAAVAFSLPSLLVLSGGAMPVRGRSYAVAVAAGILLALALGDLFPESLELAGRGGIAGFIGGFALLFLVETLTHAHTHHAPEEPVHKHALAPFVLGLALHNFADGFALGISASTSTASAVAIGFGVLVHQLPVALSLAAVFAAAHTSRRSLLRVTVLLALVIPLAAALTVALPAPGEGTLGVLIGVAGGVLTYISTAHLLPEAQAEEPRTITGLLFAATLTIATLALFTVLEG